MKGSLCIGECRKYGDAARTARGGLERGGEDGEGADDVLSMVGVGEGGEAGEESLDDGDGGDGGVGGGLHCCEWKVRVTKPGWQGEKRFLVIPRPRRTG